MQASVVPRAAVEFYGPDRAKWLGKLLALLRPILPSLISLYQTLMPVMTQGK